MSATDATALRLTRTERGVGGIWIWTRDAAGTEHHDAHLDPIPPGLAPGSRVAAGMRIGAVGNTGDARYGAPHLHFEVHPNGGRASTPTATSARSTPALGRAGWPGTSQRTPGRRGRRARGRAGVRACA